MLVAPGSLLGGARPKASVVDEHGQLWIAKFPSGQDEYDVGAWEAVVKELAQAAGLRVATGQVKRFNSRPTSPSALIAPQPASVGTLPPP